MPLRADINGSTNAICIVAIIITLFPSMLAAAVVPGVNYRSDYSVYHTLERFESQMAAYRADERFTSILRMDSSGRSIEQRPIHRLHLSNHQRSMIVRPLIGRNAVKAQLKSKPRILMVFGEHARELIVVESFIHLVNNITMGYLEPCSTAAGHFARWVLNHVDLHLIGLLNPDGKAHLEASGDDCWRGNARGVDLNRNAEWQFGGPGSSSTLGSEEYNGGRPWSEPESTYIKSLAESMEFDAYINIHSGEQQVFVPFVDTLSKQTNRRRPSTEAELALANEIVNDSNGWFRNSGIAYEMNSYSADGAIFDWIAGVKNVPYVICAEVWGDGKTAACFEQFNPRGGDGGARLRSDLNRIHPLYVTSLIHIVNKLTGVIYEPLHNNLTVGERQLLDALCKVEDQLDENHQRTTTAFT